MPFDPLHLLQVGQAILITELHLLLSEPTLQKGTKKVQADFTI